MGYDALYNYKNKFNPATLPGYPEGEGLYHLEDEIYDPGAYFRLYLPPGANRATLVLTQIYQNGKIGVAVRKGYYPRCYYDLHEEDYYDLPWGSSGGTTVSELNGKDFQGRNAGGAIWLLDGQSVPSAEAGEWIYLRRLWFENIKWNVVQFTVRVDAPTYKTWYTDFGDWDAGGNPIEMFSGGNCGYCSDAWGTPQPDCPAQGDFVPFMVII